MTVQPCQGVNFRSIYPFIFRQWRKQYLDFGIPLLTPRLFPLFHSWIYSVSIDSISLALSATSPCDESISWSHRSCEVYEVNKDSRELYYCAKAR